MRIVLVVHSGPEAGRFVAIPAGSEVTVGRKAPARFVVAEDPTLSRAHFALSRVGTRCRVRDLGSTAGTLLNGEPVNEAEVRAGDVIVAGSTDFVVRFEAGDDPPRPPAPPRPTPPANTARQDGPTEELPALDLDSPQDRALKQLRAQAGPLFAILDAARDPLVLARLRGCGETYRSLYEGPKADQLAEAAPYLVSIPPGSPFLEPLVREGWGRSWGVYLTSGSPFAEVRKHLRRFLLVKTEEGRELYFRYYDPRVLRTYLPTCRPAELADFFGPIRSFLIEVEAPGGFESATIENGALVRKPISIRGPSAPR